jgi:archaellum component FlaC
MEQLLKQMMNQMHLQFEKINKGFEQIDQQFIGINQRLDRVETSIQALKDTVENNASEFRSHFKHIENKLENHDRMFDVVAEEMRRGNCM